MGPDLSPAPVSLSGPCGDREKQIHACRAAAGELDGLNNVPRKVWSLVCRAMACHGGERSYSATPIPRPWTSPFTEKRTPCNASVSE
jgi:hypothetical protein